jgi:hypothetical protein
MAETSEENSDEMKLGGNIRLSGFRDIDGGSMIIVRKLVGSAVRRFSEISPVDEISFVLKPIHQNEDNKKYEIHGKLRAGGEIYNSDFTDKNLFVSLDKVLKKIEAMIEHGKV